MLPNTSAGNEHVAKGVASLYGSEEDSDCVVVFYLKPNNSTDQSASVAGDGPSSKRQRLADGSSTLNTRGEGVLIGEPLPGHQLVLRFASDRFGAQLKRWDTRRSRVGVSSGAPDLAATPAPTINGRPMLRVQLSNEADEPSARAAIRYAYTGRVHATTIREALQVRRQAINLRIEGCAEACMEIVRAKLAAATATTATDASGSSATGSYGAGQGLLTIPSSTQQHTADASAVAATAGGPPSTRDSLSISKGVHKSTATVATSAAASAQTLLPPPPPVLEFFYCLPLWPDPAEDKERAVEPGGSTSDAAAAGPGSVSTVGGCSGGFTAIVAAAKPRLVTHFGDVLRTLNTRHLRQQLLALPALALEALLSSDDFGTDTESSVLLLLATWMEANFIATDADTRRRLCRHVRLVQLSKPYLYSVLPILALDYETAGVGAGGATAASAPLAAAPPQGAASNAAAAPAGLSCPAAWFPISGAEAAFIASLATSVPPLSDALAAAGRKVYDISCSSSAWYDTRPRRQALPRAGFVYRWHILLPALGKALEGLAPGGLCCIAGSFDNSDFNVVSAAGFEWWPSIEYRYGAPYANLGLYSQIPEALQVPGSRFLAASGQVGSGQDRGSGGGSKKTSPVVAVAGLDADLSVHRWQNGGATLMDDGVYFSTAKDMWAVGGGRGANVLTLSPHQQPQPGTTRSGGGCAASAGSLSRRATGASTGGGAGAAGAAVPADGISNTSRGTTGGGNAGSLGGSLGGTGPLNSSRTSGAGSSAVRSSIVGGSASGAGGLSGPLAAWSEYLRDGKVTGTLTLLLPCPP